MMVVPVLITSCHVSLKPKSGPLTAQRTMTRAAAMNVVGRPVASLRRRPQLLVVQGEAADLLLGATQGGTRTLELAGEIFDPLSGGASDSLPLSMFTRCPCLELRTLIKRPRLGRRQRLGKLSTCSLG